MPNNFAYLMLIIWPVISLILFNRFKPLTASLWTIVGGYMILPEETFYDFPVLPSLNKQSIAALTALVGCYFVAKQRVPLIPKGTVEKGLIIICLVAPIITTLTNQEPFRGKSGMSIYDAASFIQSSYIGFIPFLLGLHLVKTHEDQLTVMKWLVVAGLVYSIAALFEVRMSPQLHRDVYGFFPHEWGQQIRLGGFRPVVFMQHGLIVATFFAISLMCAISLWRDDRGFFGNTKSTQGLTFFAAMYLLVVLLLCKSFGAIFFGLIFLLITTFLPLGAIRLATVSVIGVVITYPLSSLLGIFPHQSLVDLASYVSIERAGSLAFRFANEDIMLSHAKEKIFFGWGLWGRNRPFSEVVTDGYWILLLGSVGLISFIAWFGLPTLSIFRALRASRRLQNDNGRKLIVFYALLIAMLMIDQIVNASMSSYMWLLIGGLMGRANYVLNNKPKSNLDVVT